MKKIGRYNVISELGRGAMGIVYKASDPTIGREVALKVISLNSSSEEGTNSPQQMFMREVRAAGRLTHHSIVTIHDAFDDPENQTSCIVMELVPGVTLEKMLDSGHIPSMDQTLDIMRQVAEGLDYAHRNQVIHRDLKPANILVTEDWRAKITDFGIAKVLAREGIARTVGIMGTPSYMSPEQVKGGEIDARTDIFSLGIIIFTMLTGKKPFSGNTAAVMFQIVYEEPPAAYSINPLLTPAHDYVVKRCLAKDREQRYSSARELVGDLEDLQHGRLPRSQALAPAAAPPVAEEGSVPERTMSMPIPDLMKSVTGQPAPPPPRHSAPTQYVAAQPPAPPTPHPAPPVEAPSAPVPTERTVAMPIPSLMKSVSGQPTPHPAPPPPPTQYVATQSPWPSAPHPGTPGETGGPPSPVPTERTVAMPIPSLMKSVSGQPAPRPAPHPPPYSAPTQYVAAQPPAPATPYPAPPVEVQAPSAPVPTERTMAMPIPALMRGASQPPAKAVVSPPSPVPVQPPKPVIPPPPPPAWNPGAQTVVEQPMPMRVPDRSAGGHSAPPPPPAKAAPHVSAGRAQAAGPQMAPSAPPPQVAAEPAVEPAETPGAVLTAPKSKLLPAILAGVAVVVLLGAVLGYWKYHQSKMPAPPPQVAVQTSPVPPAPATVETPTPTPPPAAAQPTPPVKTTPEVAKKTAVKKAKPTAAPTPPVPEPTPPPPQPQPVAVTPPPQPSPPKPSPEEVAKAEAAKFANVPRIVQVSCNYGFKEATFTFFSGGQTLYGDTFKGKKKKGGFLGIKGSYQGSFTHTLTVPAGVSEVSIHVVSKDGDFDAVKAIKMPAPGGFVPTLAVEADGDHLTLSWQNAPAAK
jgi:serine/threonine-protein kinase